MMERKKPDFGRVLVAGGSGFIGFNLVKRLAADGHPVRATWHSRKPSTPPPSVDFVQADLREAGDCARALDGIDTVFLCAAITSGAAVIRGDPLAHVTPNVVLNARMLEAAHGAGVRRFVFLSTGCVYPDSGSRPVREDEALDGPPHDAYFAAGWMKRYGEILCRTYAERVTPAMPCTVVRPANAYGPFDKFAAATSHVTAAMIRKVFEHQDPIEVWGTGEDVRDVIYIDDFIEGLVRAAAHPAPYFEVNIASGSGHSVRQILDAAIRAGGRGEVAVVCRPDKPTTIPVLLFDTAVARRELGFAVSVPLEEGLRRTFAWLRETPPAVWDR